MSVYGIGAMYGGKDDVSGDFKRLGVACIHWAEADAPAAHRQMASVKAGDVFFIKSYPPQIGLQIKAVGIVIELIFAEITDARGWGVSVRWLDVPGGLIVFGPLKDHADNMRHGTLYEEFNPKVIARVLDILVPAGRIAA